MRLVCSTLGVARSHLVALLKRPDNWIDCRTARCCSDDTSLLEDVRQVIHGLGTYGYRRVWGVLRHQHPRPNGPAANHKRVYRVMRDHGLLLYRRGQRPVATRRHDGKVAVDSSNTRWCSDGLNWLATMANGCGWPLHWTAVIGKS